MTRPAYYQLKELGLEYLDRPGNSDGYIQGRVSEAIGIRKAVKGNTAEAITLYQDAISSFQTLGLHGDALRVATRIAQFEGWEDFDREFELAVRIRMNPPLIQHSQSGGTA